ncbi:unnamed protein product [Medioppia subpectinata]|uniref:Carboxylesterase type B domain-containing protein n=1 Tax=Medioppia subpectinata TaxID=1979941 RepID=A0A7R9KPZ5_9ACAR|nr:unnamed protein product [Medioppia subpectinata]CAG2107546.1 unnamed protein product [Medioppia subpectinata]
MTGLTIDVLNTSVDQFLAIPYAEPPVGVLRFAKPVPLRHPIQDIIDGTETGNSCYQLIPDLLKPFVGNLTLSEDCLVLNVWTPHVTKKSAPKAPLKPVMFWIHGGALILGSSFQEIYNGTALATNNVVVVSINYRLANFGFLYGNREDAPGNVGFYDQLLALKWVRENIHKFGGDRDQITIFGESAGSWSVSVQLLSPLSKGLFKRAIMESGAHMFNKDRDIKTAPEALNEAKQLAVDFNCSKTSVEWLECLRQLNAEDLNEHIGEGFTVATLGTEYLPVSAHQAFQTKQFNKDLELLAGVSKHEGSSLLSTLIPVVPKNISEKEFHDYAQGFDSMFHNLNADNITTFYMSSINKSDPEAVKWQLYDLFGDLLITCPTHQFAVNYGQQSAESNVYFYELTYHRTPSKPGPDMFGVTHGDELQFVFGLPFLYPQKTDTEIDKQFSRDVMKMWTDFAKYGKPTVDWPKLIDNKVKDYVPKAKELNPYKLWHNFNNLFNTTCDDNYNTMFNIEYTVCIEVNTTSGVVKGLTIDVLNTSVDQFLAIPYAEPPVGVLRFAKPVPLRHPIQEIIDGTETGNSCYQNVPDYMKDFVGNLTLSEDCLVLNVWTLHMNKNSVPKAPLKPVMFFIHGGALILGSSFQEIYNGTALATNDVVVVSINYRLGPFGFLYGDREDAPGNMGFYDQLLALKWVRENIHKFGGDRDQITIFGESAGSWSVSVQLLSPLSKGLFKRAIMESGAHMFNKDRDITTAPEALTEAKQLAKHFNCSQTPIEWLECLRQLDAEELNNAPIGAAFIVATLGTEYLPVSAHQAFQTKQFNKDLELLAGVAQHEGSSILSALIPVVPKNITQKEFHDYALGFDSIFHNLNADNITTFYMSSINKSDPEAVKWQLYDLFGDLMITCPTHQFAVNYGQQSAESNVYFYELTYHRTPSKPGPDMFGVTHGDEIQFVFGLPFLYPQKTDTEVDKQFSRDVMKMWTDFAKYGKPTVDWPKLIDNKVKDYVPKAKELNPYKLWHNFNNLFNTTCDGFWKHYYN